MLNTHRNRSNEVMSEVNYFGTGKKQTFLLMLKVDPPEQIAPRAGCITHKLSTTWKLAGQAANAAQMKAKNVAKSIRKFICGKNKHENSNTSDTQSNQRKITLKSLLGG